MSKQPQQNFNYFYFVSSDTDNTVLLGMNLKLSNDLENEVRWFDTIKERVMHVEKIIDSNPEHFVFQRKSTKNEIYTFIPLTLDIYNEKVKHKTLIPRDFTNTEDMVTAFKETRNNAW